MTAIRTARERARAELTDEIKSTARRQLAETGAGQLSLRAIARELGMVSSALYRYFPSRDDLLTALIIDAYDAIGAAVEAASDAVRADGPRARWTAACRAVRTWARQHPHEYALLYGTPVPGYRAPQDTVASAMRVPAALLRPVHDAFDADRLRSPLASSLPAPHDLPSRLTDQAHEIAAVLAPGLSEDAVARALIAWTQLFGMVTFELFGQFTGGIDPADEFFEHAMEQMADYVGLLPD
jgi:AcrR family transcriptional regulator